MAKQDKDGAKKQAAGPGIAGAVKSAVGGAVAKVAHRLDEHPGGHAAAKAHGQRATVDDTLPDARPELVALHAEARRKRAAAPLGSDAYRAAADEIGRIEVRIAAVERAMTPPKG